MTSLYVYNDPDRLLEWAEDHIPDMRFADNAHAIGHERDGRLVAVTGYDHFSSTDCMMHIASDGSSRWLTLEFLLRCFRYPFVQLEFPRVTGLVSVRNRRALQLNHRLGWVQEGVMRRAGEHGEDMVLMGMLKEECRWIQPDLVNRVAMRYKGAAHDVQAREGTTHHG